MSNTGRSYDYYDMKADDNTESENEKVKKQGKTDKIPQMESGSDSSPVRTIQGSNQNSMNQDKELTNRDSGASQTKEKQTPEYDPTKYMKIYTGSKSNSKRNGNASSSSTDKKDNQEELLDKIRKNISIEGQDLVYKMELIEGNNLKKNELHSKSPIDDGKPMFYIDPTPIAVFTKKENEELFIPLEKNEKDSEKRYFVVGQDRFFKTQEKSLVEKLNKFLTPTKQKLANDKPEEEKNLEDEILVDPEMGTSNRYFGYNPGETCRRCKRPGHYERMCPEEVRIKCHYCAKEHYAENCNQFICFLCLGTGHRAKDCTIPKTQNCYRCGKRGHKREECGMLILRETHRDKKDTAKETKCIKCHKYGHIACDHVNLNQKGYWNDDIFMAQQETKEKPVTHPQQKFKRNSHVFFANSSDEGENRIARNDEEDSYSEEIDDSHFKSFLKSFSKEELTLMSSDDSEKELKKLKKQEKQMKKEKRMLKLSKSEETKPYKHKEKKKNFRKDDFKKDDFKKDDFKKEKRSMQRRIENIKRDRRRSSSKSQGKIKKVKSY